MTFNHAALSREMEGGTLLLRVRGTEYLAEVHRMNFEQIDDDIDSYEGGRIVGVGESDVLLTTSENGLIGSVTLGRETFRIEGGVEPRARAERSASPCTSYTVRGGVRDGSEKRRYERERGIPEEVAWSLTESA